MTAGSLALRPLGRAELLLWALCFLFAFGVSWLIPPVQSPDENSHVARAYMLSQGKLLLDRDPIRGSGGMIDHELMVYLAIHGTIAGKPEAGRLAPWLQERADVQAHWKANGEKFDLLPGTGYYLPLIYAPLAAGLAVGQALDLRISTSYRIGRALVLLVCIVLLATASRFVLPNPVVLGVIFLPMSTFQLVTPSLDGLTNCLTLLAVSVFLHAWTRPSSTRSTEVWILAACVALLATVRTQLTPLLLMPFLLAHRRRSWRELVPALLAAVLSAVWIAYAITTTYDPRIARQHTTIQILSYYLIHPPKFFDIAWATLSNNELRNFYIGSFIGSLGWLDTSLRWGFYPAIKCGLLVLLMASLTVPWNRSDGVVCGYLVAAAIASAALVFFALLITWTPHPARFIDGVQGRYFLASAIVLAFAASGSDPHGAWARRRVSLPLMLAYAAMCLVALVDALLLRFH